MSDRVLVAEDNELLAEHLVRILSPHWEVVVSRDGDAAWAEIQRDPPSLVLADVMMPGLDGIQLCEQIRSRPETREIPVVIVTALGEIEDRLRGFDAGADEYVTKPFAARELVARLRVLLDLRQARRRVEAYAATLETLVEEQVGHIMQQNAQLTRAAREMEDLLAVASHDLRSPLVSIAGFADLIETKVGQSMDPQSLHALERIRINVQWMSSLTLRLLSLASVQSSKHSLTHFQMDALVARVADRCRESIEADGGTLVWEEGLPACFSDEVQVEEALANLLENASKYRSAERPLRVRLWGRCEGETLHLHLEDNGIGIASADLERIFEPLVRLRSGVGRGIGLGMHIVRRVAEELGGKAWVESVEGQGSTAHLVLPTCCEVKGEPTALSSGTAVEGGETGGSR